MRCAVLAAAMLALMFSWSAADQWESHVRSNNITDIWGESGLVYWSSTAGVVILDLVEPVSQEKILKSKGQLRSNHGTAIARDLDGRLWMGTSDAGLTTRSQDGGVWGHHGTDNYHLLSDEVLDLATRGARTVAGTSGGVSLFEGGEFVTFFDGTDWADAACSKVVSAALSDQQVLVGTECGVFAYQFESGTWSTVLRGRSTISMDYDETELLWIVTEDSIYTYDGQVLGVIPKTLIRLDVIYDIGASDSTVWVMTSSGPSRYNFVTRRWDKFNGGLPSYLRDASSVHVVPDGDIWIGTRDGAAVFSDGSWVMYKSAGPGGNYVEDIEVDTQGKVWCSTGYRWGGGTDVNIGLLTFDGLGWEQISSPTLTTNNAYCLDLNPLDGSLWVGFWGGALMSYDPFADSWTVRRDLVQSNVISDIYIDAAGNMYLGEYLTGVGVVCSQGQEDIHYTNEDVPMCVESECVTAIGPGPEGVLIGGYVTAELPCPPDVVELGIGADCTGKDDDRCRVWTERDGYVVGFVYDFALDIYGVAWLATSGGLSCYDGRWHAISTSIGAVWDIEVDSAGNKWIAADKGLYLLKGFGTDWSQFSDDYEVFDKSNSPLDESPVKALAFDADGALWIGTAGGGIYRFERAAEEPKKHWVDVFPNPYYAWEDKEGNGIRFVGFLPGSTIKIFTLAGDMVAEVDHDRPWLAKNASGREVVSGVYIYHAYAQDGSQFVGRLVIVR